MPSRHDHDAALREIARGLALDDRRLAHRLAAGPTYPLRRARRWSAALTAVALCVVPAGAIASSEVTVGLAATLALLGAMTVAGLSIVLWSSNRHAATVLAPHVRADDDPATPLG